MAHGSGVLIAGEQSYDKESQERGFERVGLRGKDAGFFVRFFLFVLVNLKLFHKQTF